MNDLTTFLIILFPFMLLLIIAPYAIGYENGRAQERKKIKKLGEALRETRNGIHDLKMLTGFNIAIAICNKYLKKEED